MRAIVLISLLNRWIRCDPDTARESSIDCATLHAGAFCGTYNGVEGCIPAGAACDGFGPVPLRCDDSSLVTCVRGHEFAIDCAAREGYCMDSGATSACVPDATACKRGTPDVCSGASLQICVDGTSRPSIARASACAPA